MTRSDSPAPATTQKPIGAFLPAVAVATVLAFFFCISPPELHAQSCAGTAPLPLAAADCAAHTVPIATVAQLDPNRTYTVAELIDIAEHNNPRTRIAWERARQRANALGVEKSAYFPILVFQALGADEKILSPFPEALEARGYNSVTIPTIQPELTLQYLLFDSGRRSARVDAALAEKIASGANFVQANQDVAFRVAPATISSSPSRSALRPPAKPSKPPRPPRTQPKRNSPTAVPPSPTSTTPNPKPPRPPSTWSPPTAMKRSPASISPKRSEPSPPPTSTSTP